MSLKGTELTSDMLVLLDMKKKWDEYDPKEYGGATKGTGENAFERFLCHHIFSLRKQVAAQTSIANRWKKQRNLALILCVILFALTLFFAFRPSARAEAAASSGDTISFAEWTRQQNGEYIASTNSDKYHRPSCEYVDNILEENHIHYEAQADAERDGRDPCALCLAGKRG